MSAANLRAFLDKTTTDPHLRARLDSQAPSSVDAIIRLATEHGLPFTKEDWHACTAEPEATTDELSEDELAGVNGGVATDTPATPKFNDPFYEYRKRAILLVQEGRAGR